MYKITGMNRPNVISWFVFSLYHTEQAITNTTLAGHSYHQLNIIIL